MIDYRKLSAGFYWVRWNGRLTIGQWCKREAYWITGLNGCWRLIPPVELTEASGWGLVHVWHEDQPADVDLVEPVTAPVVNPLAVGVTL